MTDGSDPLRLYLPIIEVFVRLSRLAWLMACACPVHEAHLRYLLDSSTARLSARSLTYVLGITRSQFSFFKKVACFFVHAVPGGQLAWAPKKRGRIQDSTIRFRALAACKQTPRALLMAQYPVAYQRALARKQMFAAWAREWVQTRPE